MIWFWILAGLLVVVALIALLKPLLRASSAGEDQSESVVAVFRRQLANLDVEVAQGRLAPEDCRTADGVDDFHGLLAERS